MHDTHTLDTHNSYGWVSILLHWLTAIWVFCLWFLGNSSQSSVASNSAAMVSWHVSIGTSGMVLIALRIWWRWRSEHPRIEGQTDLVHGIGKWVHYTMLAAIVLLVISGPLIPWLNTAPLILFETIVVPSPFVEQINLAEKIREIHFLASTTIIILSMLHIAGALKHMMFNHDETFIRILVPRKR